MSCGGLLNRAINALPFELHIPGFQFCGPSTRLTSQKRLGHRGDEGINPLDTACREHDIAYFRSNDLIDRYAADKVLADKARTRHCERFGSERESRRSCHLGSNESQDQDRHGHEFEEEDDEEKGDKKAKRGGALPFLPMLGALGSLIGGMASMAKAVKDSKAARCQFE